MRRQKTVNRLLLHILLFVLLFGSMSCPVSAASKTYTYYGSHLTGSNKELYKKLKKSWYKGKTDPIYAENTSSSLSAAGMWVLNDYPQYFWCNTYKSGYLGHYRRFTLVTWKKAIKKKSSFSKRLNKVVRVLKQRSSGKSEAETAVIIHDWICKNCSYVTSDYDQSAYGVLMKKKAVCAGYARCFKLLSDKLGLKCICVNAYLNGVPHLMNYVEVEGDWYLVDCTNDDHPSLTDPLRTYCLAGSDSTGAHLKSSCGVYLPVLSEEDYPLPDRDNVITAAAQSAEPADPEDDMAVPQFCYTQAS